MKTFLITGTAATMLASTAFAGNPTPAPADPVVMTPAPVASPAGYDWSGSYGGVNLGYGNAYTNTGLQGDGVIGGAQIGYNFDFGNYVLGAETEYQQSGASFGAGAGMVDNFVRVKARAGVETGPALLYATGGLTLANGNLGGTGFSDTGYAVGVGMDYALTDRWSAGVEALYNQVDNVAGTTTDLGATTVSARINYRF